MGNVLGGEQNLFEQARQVPLVRERSANVVEPFQPAKQVFPSFVHVLPPPSLG